MKIYELRKRSWSEHGRFNETLFTRILVWLDENKPEGSASLASFAKEVGVGVRHVCDLVALRVSHRNEQGEYRGVVQQIAAILKVKCHQLFPDNLYGHVQRPQGRNDFLEKMIRGLGVNLSQFAASIELRPSELSGLITLRVSPFTSGRDYRECCHRICIAIGASLQEAFPPDLYQATFAAEVQVYSLSEIDHDAEGRLHNTVDPAQLAFRRERLEIIYQALSTDLAYREREVVKLRWGLLDGHRYTLEEVSRIFKVSRERVWQIESAALKKLTNLDRLRMLI